MRILGRIKFCEVKREIAVGEQAKFSEIKEEGDFFRCGFRAIGGALTRILEGTVASGAFGWPENDREFLLQWERGGVSLGGLWVGTIVDGGLV